MLLKSYLQALLGLFYSRTTADKAELSDLSSPSSGAIELTNGQTYTCPSAGYIWLRAYSNTDSSFLVTKSSRLHLETTVSKAGLNFSQWTRVAKGETVSIGTGNISNFVARFLPCNTVRGG